MGETRQMASHWSPGGKHHGGCRLVKWGWSKGPGFDWAELESLG